MEGRYPDAGANTVSKKSISELAILGGERLFERPLHVGRPNVGDRKQLLRRIDDILERNWLTNAGAYVQEFERRIIGITGARHCVAMSNGTVALEIAIRALGLENEVIVPSFTFVATAHALQWQGITPVFCDIDPQTCTIDPLQIESLITPRTTGIIGVHLWGRPCNVDALEAVARRHGLALMFDAAHAFGCSHRGRMIGQYGQAEVFSFHATKMVNSFEGGAVVTNDDDLAERMRLMKNFGFAGLDEVVYIGTNGKMSEISAAMGITSLESMDIFVATNRCNYHAYLKCLSDVPGVSVFRFDEGERCNYHYVTLMIDAEATGIDRDMIADTLRAENVLARRYFYPACHRMEPYKSYFPNAGMLLPNTEEISSRVITLPTGSGVSIEDIEKICSLIRFVAEQGSEVSACINANRLEQAEC